MNSNAITANDPITLWRKLRSTVLSPRARRVTHEMLWVGIGQIVAAVGSIVGVRLLTSFLSPRSYGEVALALTAVMLAQQVVFSPLCAAFLRFFAPAIENVELGSYICAVRRLMGHGTLILSALAAACAAIIWLASGPRWIGLLAATLLFALFFSYKSALDHIQIAARQRVVVAWHQGLDGWLRFLLAVAALKIWGISSTVAMLGYAGASVAIFVSQLIFFRWKILPKATDTPLATAAKVQSKVVQMRGYAWPFCLWGIFTWAQFASDRWALQSFTTTSTVGYYAVLYQLGYYPLMMLSASLLQLVIPMLFQIAGDGSDPVRMAKARRMNSYLVLGSLAATLAAALLTQYFAKPLLGLLVAPEYRSVAPFLGLMVLASGLFGCGQVASQSLLAGVKTTILLTPKIVTAVAGTLFNFAGAYFLGLRGVVFANVAFALFYFIWMRYLSGRAVLTPVDAMDANLCRS